MTYESYETIEKNKGGRPLLFSSPEELSDKVDAYFEWCNQDHKVKYLNKRGDIITGEIPKPYTIEGLAIFLKCSPDTLRNYAKRDEFFEIVSRARYRIHESWVDGMLKGTISEKAAALCLAANTKTYNVTKVTEQHNTLTIEDTIRQARKKRLAENVPEAEYKKVTE